MNTQMIKFEDHTDPETKKINWETYREAEIAIGSRCYRCGHSSCFGPGYRDLCSDCKNMDENSGEVTSSNRVRCPNCTHQMSPNDDLYELYEEGTHEICCDECGEIFEVETSVSYSFESPALKKEEKGAV